MSWSFFTDTTIPHVVTLKTSVSSVYHNFSLVFNIILLTHTIGHFLNTNVQLVSASEAEGTKTIETNVKDINI